MAKVIKVITTVRARAHSRDRGAVCRLWYLVLPEFLYVYMHMYTYVCMCVYIRAHVAGQHKACIIGVHHQHLHGHGHALLTVSTYTCEFE